MSKASQFMGETRPNTKRQSRFVSGLSALLLSATSLVGVPSPANANPIHTYWIYCSSNGAPAFSGPAEAPASIYSYSIELNSTPTTATAFVNFGGIQDEQVIIRSRDCDFGGFGTNQLNFNPSGGEREIATPPVPKGTANPSSFVIYVTGIRFQKRLELRLMNFTPQDKIQEFNRTSNASSMTIDDLEAAGAIRLDPLNLEAYKLAVSRGGLRSLVLDTVQNIQFLIDETNLNELMAARNAAIAFIESLTVANSGTMTINNLLATGVGRVVESNLSNYQTAFGALAPGEANEEFEIQAIIDMVNAEVTESARLAALAAAITAIEALSLETASTLTLPDLAAAGATGLVASNLNAYRSAFGLAISGAADSTEKIQAIVNSVNLAAASSRGSGFSSAPASPVQDRPTTILRGMPITAFSSSSVKLNRELRLEIREVLRESPDTKSVTCRALSAAGATRGEIRLATSRAQAVCDFIARADPSIKVRVTKRLLKPGQESKASTVRLALR